jgi:hypothetical protein
MFSVFENILRSQVLLDQQYTHTSLSMPMSLFPVHIQILNLFRKLPLTTKTPKRDWAAAAQAAESKT